MFPEQVMPEQQGVGRFTLDVARGIVDATLAGKHPITQLEFRRRDGTRFTAELRTSLVTIAGRREVRLSLIDVTERVAAVHARAATEARFRSLFASSPTAVLVVGRDGRIIDASNMAVEVFGYSVADLRELTVEDLIPPDLRSERRVQPGGLRCPSGAAPIGHSREVTAVRADGRLIPVEVGLSWFESDEGGSRPRS